MPYPIALKNKISVLNRKAKDFYKNDSSIVPIQEKNRFKSAFLTGIIDFERTIRGVFSSDINLNNVDIRKLKQMFPNAFTNIFDIDNHLEDTGQILDSIRNINAHAFISKDDEKVFDYDFSVIKDHPKADNRLVYVDGSDITLAGLSYILLNLLRAESIAVLTKKEPSFNVVADGNLYKGDGIRFVQEVSHVDLEIDIREDKPTNVLDSVLGVYKKDCVFDGDKMHFAIGTINNPIVDINCSQITDKYIYVNKGTLTKACYKEDFSLAIEDPELFIEISNQLPPFSLVDYCYEAKITIFDKNVYAKLKDDKLLYKLNQPKFYIDKNLKILFLTIFEADYRVVSSVVVDGLNILFISLEEYFYNKYNLNKEDSYSTLRIALEKLGLSYNVRSRVIALRNMVAHGYTFGDYLYVKGELYELDLLFVKDTLYKLLEGLGKVDKDAFEFVAARVTKLIIKRALDTKYRKIDEVSFAYLANGLKGDVDELRKKRALIEHSFFNSNIFNNLSNICHSHYRIFDVYVPQLDFPLSLIANKTVLEKLYDCIDDGGYIVEKEETGIVIIYRLSK